MTLNDLTLYLYLPTGLSASDLFSRFLVLYKLVCIVYAYVIMYILEKASNYTYC